MEVLLGIILAAACYVSCASEEQRRLRTPSLGRPSEVKFARTNYASPTKLVDALVIAGSYWPQLVCRCCMLYFGHRWPGAHPPIASLEKELFFASTWQHSGKGLACADVARARSCWSAVCCALPAQSLLVREPPSQSEVPQCTQLLSFRGHG